MKTWLIGALFVVSVSGCSAYPDPWEKPFVPTAQLVTASDDYTESSLERVREKFRDPESARFKDLMATQLPGQSRPTICGSVNAKNAYGGYVGYRRFMANPDVALLWGGRVVRGRSWDSDAIISACTLAG